MFERRKRVSPKGRGKLKNRTINQFAQEFSSFLDGRMKKYNSPIINAPFDGKQ